MHCKDSSNYHQTYKYVLSSTPFCSNDILKWLIKKLNIFVYIYMFTHKKRETHVHVHTAKRETQTTWQLITKIYSVKMDRNYSLISLNTVLILFIYIFCFVFFFFWKKNYLSINNISATNANPIQFSLFPARFVFFKELPFFVKQLYI